ncbi:Tubulin-like protein [Stieleria neptunia]|uniref:Tubulin-like protein n=1 Tax=Stieleria neptunia TaxID=2527979 RepID=A0A518HKH8_9BACT|nr:tubulin-like doman-containing protein [Stieleria neptunia]QDV41279.1 Tubulin-like protein [Stieleria neptunia]
MTTVKSKRIQAGYEPIEGYVLEKRIGRGGYGEVWRAVAPGGLKKAVKFVFGQQDERRAEQELKSLERIKSVQHPFILTLERFELIENQLVIVTELADGSLEDVFKQHQGRGSCGIPRDVLLGYMKDAADALDYLHQLYKLQHLDIKPANLLIVGGRVKVADFGLLKDLGEVECSMVGGLTPIYAPPEVFDGRPSLHSDQYSLAVMYQELLTSTRPFSGRTIAQLATQHVHNAPNLKPLPASDRPCVARALEKSPERRFASCTEFVEKLFRPHAGQGADANHTVDTVATEPAAHAVENLPQLDGSVGSPSDVQQSQALVVALGGTGADCLSELRSRVYEFGAGSPVVLHSVLIDTNPVTTQTALMVDGTDVVPRCRVVEARLRTPNEYRNSGTGRLKTISRRWIYNVPRNGHTGGMRPLGRLALVDHGEQVMQTLRDAVEALKVASGETGRPKIYVVGSLTGGTGSGMYLDIVYLLRHLLDESAMENEPILSFLTTNRFQGDPSRPLALHSTKSAIRELAHFLMPGNSYPGDAGVGWPSVPAARTPLHNTYVIAQSDRPGAPSPLHSVVDYLWADATVCGELFARGRHEEDDSPSGQRTIRTMGVAQIGDPGERQPSLLAPHSIKLLLLRWLGNPRDSKPAAKEFASRVWRRCRLDSDALRGQTEQWFGNNRQARRSKLMERLGSLDPSLLKNPAAVRSHLVKWLTGVIDLDQTEVLAGQIVEQIEREINARIQDARLNLSSTITGLNEIRHALTELQQTLLKKSDDEFRQLADGGQASADQPPTSGAVAPQRPMASLRSACGIGEQLVAIIACRAAASVATALAEKLADLTETYIDASTRLAQAIANLADDDVRAVDQWSTLPPTVRDQLPGIVDQLHTDNVASQLFRIIQTPVHVTTDSVVNEISVLAAGLIRERIAPSGDSQPSDSKSRDSRGSDCLDTKTSSIATTDDLVVGKTTCFNPQSDPVAMTQTHSWSSPSKPPSLTAESAFEAVRPPLLECGGKQRIYLICRDASEQTTLQSQIPGSKDVSLTSFQARASMPMLVHEARDIKLDNVLSWLDALTGDDGRISDRLATRCDLDWS